MNVYIAMIDDRHSDTEAHPFREADAAIEFAKAKAQEYAPSPEDFEEQDTPEGWLYYATYGSAVNLCC